MKLLNYGLFLVLGILFFGETMNAQAPQLVLTGSGMGTFNDNTGNPNVGFWNNCRGEGYLLGNVDFFAYVEVGTQCIPVENYVVVEQKNYFDGPLGEWCTWFIVFFPPGNVEDAKLVVDYWTVNSSVYSELQFTQEYN